MRSLSLLCAVCLGVPALAQPIIGGAGHSNPVPLPVAPGQLITLFIQGVNTQLTAPVRASGGSLPTMLAGVSVTYRQGTDRAAPILEVRPISSCLGIPQPAGSTCGTILAVTAQMPFEMLTLCPICGRPDIPASIAATVNGTTGPFLSVQPLADQVHIVTACEVTMDSSASPPLTGGLPCPPMITHADGKLVNVSNPAHSGEELVAYATGLGQTDPPQQTGKAAPSAASTVTAFSIDFNYRPNALATKPFGPVFGLLGPTPVFSGVTQGFAGLYQVNFVVPTPPASVPACVDPATIVAFGNVVVSNLTVSIGSNFSFDGAGICVQPAS
jgi:uncharacterized protein (TIGR03437 family)